MTTPTSDLTPGWRTRASLPALAALATALATGGAAWLVVRDDARRSWRVGVIVGGEVRFVAMVAVVAGAVAYVLVRRGLFGPALTEVEWTLRMPRIAATVAGYRDAPPPSVGDLCDRLAQRGYRLAVVRVDVHGNALGPSDQGAALAGCAVQLCDDRLGGAPAGVVVRVAARAGDGPGLATVRSRDRRGDRYHELAQYVIAALDELISGVTYGLSDSALSPDVAAALRELLPPTPRALASSE